MNFYNLVAAKAILNGMDRAAEKDKRLRDAAPDLYEALDALVVELCDYMRINHLGDPEKKHNIKLARAAMRKAKPDNT